MIKLDFNTLAKEVKGELVQSRFGTTVFEGVSIDSRTIAERQLFVAVKGEKDDGHKYIDDVLKRTGAGLLIQRDYPDLPSIKDTVPIVIVENTHESMMRLARSYRRRLSACFIAITGSNGKTTTKEFIYAMIASKEKLTYRSSGNLNNLFGFPLAIFAMPQNSKYGVFELGISVPGEMTRLAEMAVPDLALITNVGPTHLETLSTIEGVAEAKLELVDMLSDDKPVILNKDFPVLMKAASRRKRNFITYGIETNADFTARAVGISDDGFPIIEIDGSRITIKLFGEHQAYNLLAGYAVCKVLGLNIKASELDNIEYRFAPYRGEIENINGLTLIADCYNANPASMESGLESLRRYLEHPAIQGRTNIVVVGDMLELGERSEEYHREIGILLARLHFDMVVAVGPHSESMRQAAVENGYDAKRIKHFSGTEEAGAHLVDNVMRGDIIYLKASRGIGLEKIITLLKGTAFRQN